MTLKPEQMNDIFKDHSDLDYINDDVEDDIIGMSESLHCKKPFQLLDRYDCKFINVIETDKSLILYFGIILRELETTELPNKGEKMAQSMKY